MTHFATLPQDKAVIEFVRSRLSSYFPHIKKVKYFHSDIHREEYFSHYTFFLNNKLTPLLEVKVAEKDIGKEYLETEYENLLFLKGLKHFDGSSVQSPLEQFQIGERTGSVYSYLSGMPLVHLDQEVIHASLLPWLQNFHTGTLLWLEHPEELVERLLNYYQTFYVVTKKENLFFERVHSAFAKMRGRCASCLKHDDFDLENLVLNGNKLRVKNFYYPLVHKFPLGEISYLYHRYFGLITGGEKRGFPFLFSSGRGEKRRKEISSQFLSAVSSYCEALEIERGMVPYFIFLHWVDYANTISWEVLHLSPSHQRLWEELSEKGEKGKKAYWERVAPEVSQTELQLKGGVAGIIEQYMYLT